MKWVAVGAIALTATNASAQPTPSWEIKLPPKLDAVVGATVPLPLTISVDRGFSVSKDGPVFIDVAPDPGLTIKKRRLGRSDAADPEADLPRFVVPIRADTAGDHLVKLRIRLWLCGGKVCRPIDVKRQTTIAVTAAEPATP